jgi:hypothetical protein
MMLQKVSEERPLNFHDAAKLLGDISATTIPADKTSKNFRILIT